jgi:predicted GIY-YIG superfamily endonuclease
MVANVNRDSLLEYKIKKEKIDFEKSFVFKYTFNKNILNFNKIIKTAFYSFKESYPKYKNYNLFLVNKMQNNLSSILIHNFKYPQVYKNKFKKCHSDNCKTCGFSNNGNFINLTDNFLLPISENSDCKSKNVIYIIFCSFCDTFYIGQSECLKDRIYNHVYDIKKFNYPFTKFKSVAVHFNLKYHDYKKHLSFFVLRKDIKDLEERLIIESFLINFCKKLGVRLMNDHIPEIKDYYSLRNLKLKL